jgi:hypothetical protein
VKGLVRPTNHKSRICRDYEAAREIACGALTSDSTRRHSARTVIVHGIKNRREANPAVRAFADLAGVRTLITVPMLREDELIGVIGI